MAWRIDLAVSGPGWLERTGTLAAVVRAQNANTPADVLPSGQSLTYTLTDETGATAASGTATGVTGSSEFVTSIALGAALDPSKVYIERFSGSIAGEAVDCYREARVSRHAAARRVPPVTTASVIGGQPVLGVYQSGYTSWETQVVEAYTEIAYRLWANGPAGDVWTPGQLAFPTIWLARSLIYRNLSVTPGDVYAAHADHYLGRYIGWWESARLVVDRDVDGDPDRPGVTIGGMGPSVPGPTRR